MIHTGKLSRAVSVVRHFVGHQWYLDHVFQDAVGSRPDGSLFNLQHIEGFDDRVAWMRSSSVEATLAEFDFSCATPARCVGRNLRCVGARVERTDHDARAASPQ
jgi:hypothetical protein